MQRRSLAFTRFDQAAQTWGWEADQGVSNVAEARAEWIAAKCDLIAEIVDAVEASMIASGCAVWDAMISAGEMAVYVDPIAVVKGIGK